jgi:hypothetical protein
VTGYRARHWLACTRRQRLGRVKDAPTAASTIRVIFAFDTAAQPKNLPLQRSGGKGTLWQQFPPSYLFAVGQRIAKYCRAIFALDRLAAGMISDLKLFETSTN